MKDQIRHDFSFCRSGTRTRIFRAPAFLPTVSHVRMKFDLFFFYQSALVRRSCLAPCSQLCHRASDTSEVLMTSKRTQSICDGGTQILRHCGESHLNNFSHKLKPDNHVRMCPSIEMEGAVLSRHSCPDAHPTRIVFVYISVIGTDKQHDHLSSALLRYPGQRAGMATF